MKISSRASGIAAALLLTASAAIFAFNEVSARDKDYRIGDKGPAGGWIFYDKGRHSGGWRYLEAAPEDQGQGNWFFCEGEVPGTGGTSPGSGKGNTRAIVKIGGESDIAATIAARYRGGGKSDWFLPSRDELDLMYKNLHKAGIGGFSNGDYWSSSGRTQNRFTDGWSQNFASGKQSVTYGENQFAVRAARSF